LQQTGKWTYRAVIQNGVCPIAYAIPDSIAVIALPVANFDADVYGSTVYFTNLSQNASTYQWFFGDGTSSTETNPMHNYSNEGTYNVMLIASNKFCEDTIVKPIDVSFASVAEFSNNRKVLIYPNPSQGNFTLALLGQFEEPIFVKITDALGNLVYTYTLTQTTDLKLKHLLNPGLYALSLTYNNQTITRKLTVVR
ncbi:MAG: T9SS type A sorting domain-containing protein, partial [Bacteroidales bacterium]|nr:T9SS type A sorting domain-containing protein [Bacteroidales bacterium]